MQFRKSAARRQNSGRTALPRRLFGRLGERVRRLRPLQRVRHRPGNVIQSGRTPLPRMLQGHGQENTFRRIVVQHAQRVL